VSNLQAHQYASDAPSTLYTRGGQSAARHSVFSGPRKHSGKIEISSNYHSTANVSAETNLNRDLLR